MTPEESPIRCIYLTRSVEAATELQALAHANAICFERTTGLAETILLIERTSVAQVVLVDLPSSQSELAALLHALRHARPLVAIVVVADEVDAEKWPEVMRSGAVDMVLRPFRPQELVPVLKAAHKCATCGRLPNGNSLELAEFDVLNRLDH